MRTTSTWPGRISAALVVTVLGVALCGATPAAAVTDDERFTAYDDAAIAITEEVGWLVRLDALAEPVPASIRAMPDNIGLPVLGRDEMLDALRKVDGRGPQVWNSLLAIGETPSLAVRDSLRLIPQGAMDVLAAGGNPAIPADGYDVAYSDVIDVWGPLYNSGAQRVSASSSGGGTDMPSPTVASDPTPTFTANDDTTAPQMGSGSASTSPSVNGGAPTADGAAAPTGALQPRPANAGGKLTGGNATTGKANAGSFGNGGAASPTTVPARAESPTPTIASASGSSDGAAAPGDGAGGAPVPIIGAAIGAALLLVGLAVWLLRRRGARVERAGDDTVTVAVADLFELSRVLPTLRTPEAVADHAVHVVRGVVGTDAAVAVVDENLLPLAGELQLGASALRPVLEAGTRVRRSIGEQAFIAAPLVTAGRVCGAVVASRTGKGFTVAVEDQLGQVATLMASSLQAAFDHRDAERMAYVDGLTQVANRRRFDLDLSDALRNAQGGAQSVSLAMVDIDHFKRLNDTYGHQTGDAVLRDVAATIKANVRAGDVVYRYGGEEFAVLLPGADAAQAAEVVERVREAVQTRHIADDHGRPIEVTVSVGVARSLADEPRDLLAAADGALYEAKDGGRNRVVVAER